MRNGVRRLRNGRLWREKCLPANLYIYSNLYKPPLEVSVSVLCLSTNLSQLCTYCRYGVIFIINTPTNSDFLLSIISFASPKPHRVKDGQAGTVQRRLLSMALPPIHSSSSHLPCTVSRGNHCPPLEDILGTCLVLPCLYHRLSL